MVKVSVPHDLFPPPFQAVTEIEDPTSGEIVSIDDIDSLIDMYERLDRQNKKIYQTMLATRKALGNLTEGDAKTRYVQGKRRKAKVVMPDETWDNSLLKEAWNSYPHIAPQYLRIAKIDPQKREVKKLLKTSTDQPDLETFREIVARAQREPVGAPTVSVEK